MLEMDLTLFFQYGRSFFFFLPILSPLIFVPPVSCNLSHVRKNLLLGTLILFLFRVSVCLFLCQHHIVYISFFFLHCLYF